MAIRRFAGDKFTGLNSDTKPSDVLIGATFTETDTGVSYVYDGTNWIEPDYVVTGDISDVGFSNDYNDLDNLPDLSVLAEVVQVANYAALPVTGNTNKVYITKDTGYMYRWSGSAYTQLTDQTAIWGQISGTLSSQSDLQSALNAKYNNPSGTAGQYVRGDGTLATFPSVPAAANNATITIRMNSATVDTFTVDQSANKTIDLGTVVTDVSGKENVSNKKTTLADNSDTYYPTQKAVKTAVDAKFNTPSGTSAQYIKGDGTLGTFPSIPTVNDNSLTLLDSTTVEHDANDTVFTANSATNKSFKLKLTSAVTTDIAKGVTANGWGNHASAGYIKKVEDDGTPKLAANLNANFKKITGLANGIDPNDAVNKSQLDAAVGSGLSLAGSAKEIQFNNGSGNLGASSLLQIDTTTKVLTTPDLKLTVTGNNNTAANDTEAVFKIKNTTVGPDTIVEVLANLGNGNDVIFARYIA